MLIWTKDDIALWQQFCMDTNPLHYDDQAAKKLGYPAPIVPGMLLSLPILQSFFEEKLTGQIQLFFKKPALIATPYLLKKNSAGMKLYIEGGNDTIVTTRTLSPPPPPDSTLLKYKYTETLTPLALSHISLQQYVPAITINAMLFKNLLKNLNKINIGTQYFNELLNSGNVFHLSHTLSVHRPVDVISQVTPMYFSIEQLDSTLSGWSSYLYVRAETENSALHVTHLFGVKT